VSLLRRFVPAESRAGFSIRRRFGLSLLGVLSVTYAVLLVSTEQLINRDRLQRHERLVMATAESIGVLLSDQGQPPKKILTAVEEAAFEERVKRVMEDFSAARVMVWLSRPGKPPMFPSSPSVQGFFANPKLLEVAGINSPGMQKPRAFTFEGETYFTCSMPLPSGEGVLRFIEDVGVTPASRQSNLTFLALTWLVSVSLVLILIQLILNRTVLKPLAALERGLDSIELNPSGSIGSMAVSIDAQPNELKGIALSYQKLAERLEKTWSTEQLLVRAMSHELLTPLSLITASCRRVIRRASSLEPSIQSSLVDIQEESYRAEKLTKNLVDLARGESGTVSLSVKAIAVREVIADLQAVLSKLAWTKRVNLQLESQNENELLGTKLSVDPERLRDCILNLIENGIKYSSQQSEILVLISADHSRVDFRVIDEGPGVPDEFKQSIFKPFNRGVGSSSAVSGSGVGLAVVKLITERMYGSVFVVDNDAGKGSCFVLRFPVSASSSVVNSTAIGSQ